MLNRFIISALIAILCASPAVASEKDDYSMISPYLRGAFLEADNDLIHAYSYYMYAHRFDKGNVWIKLRLAQIT